jgi:hypothetical protein
VRSHQILSDDENRRDFRVADNRIFYIDDEGVQSLILENGQFKKREISYQLKGPGFIHV